MGDTTAGAVSHGKDALAMTRIAPLIAALVASALAQQQDPGVISDPGMYGPQVEIVHLYYDQWPTGRLFHKPARQVLTGAGIAVSRSGRMFSNYPPALDPMNQAYTVAEIFSNNTERPYPSSSINSPPGGRINNTVFPPTGAGLTEYFIGVQSVVVDPADRLWVLDTGRVATANGTQLTAAYGGPKLVGIDLETNAVFKTIVFEPIAAPADSVRHSYIMCGLRLLE